MSDTTVYLKRGERIVVHNENPISDDELIALGNFTRPVEMVSEEYFQLGEPFVGTCEMLVIRAEHFPHHGAISGRAGIALMQNLGFRPPTLREFYAFGAQPMPGKWLTESSDRNEYVGSASPWYMVIGLNLHSREPKQHWFDGAPAIYSHAKGRGLVHQNMYNCMVGAWPRNPWYLWVPSTVN